MKILMLTPYLPYPPSSGGQTRSYNLIKNLSRKHGITLFSLIKDDSEKKHLPELKKYCKKVKVFKRSKSPWTLRNILNTGFSPYPFLVIRNLVPQERKAIEKELSMEKFDLIHAETFYVMPHIPKTKIPILLVDQTIEYLVYKHYVEEQAPFLLRPLLSIDVAKLKHWETHFWKVADTVVAMSDSDKEAMRNLVPKLDVDIVPNGIDEEFFTQKKSYKDKTPKVLYVGNFKWMQNEEAALVLINKVWPRIKTKIKKAKLWIVGMNITEDIKTHKGNDIEITEGIPDIRDAYLNSSVLVTPIKGPGGTRLKILEAMASGLPVVTTSVGAEGLGVKHGKHAFISDSWKGLSKYAIEVINDPKKAKIMGRNARKFVEKNYTWKVSAEELNDLYTQLTDVKK